MVVFFCNQSICWCQASMELLRKLGKLDSKGLLQGMEVTLPPKVVILLCEHIQNHLQPVRVANWGMAYIPLKKAASDNSCSGDRH